MRLLLGWVLSGSFVILPGLGFGQQLPAPHSADSNVQHHTAALGFDDGMRSAVASCNGRFWAFSNGDVWSVATGGAVGHLGKILTTYTLSAKGTWLAYTEATEVKVWTLATGEVRTLATLDAPAEYLVGSPDESHLAVVTYKGDPQLYNIQSGQLTKQLVWSGTHRGVRREGAALMAFSPDGKLLACDTEIWAVGTGASRLVLEGSFRAFADNGRSVVTEANRTIAEWDLASGKQTSSFDIAANGSADFAFSGDGRWMAVSDWRNAEIALWDVYAGLRSKVVHLPRGYHSLFISDSDWLLATTLHAPTLLIRVSTAEEIASILSSGKEWALVRSSDGAYDGSPAVVTPPQGRMQTALRIDRAPVDRLRFEQVPGLLGKLPGAPSGAPPSGRSSRR